MSNKLWCSQHKPTPDQGTDFEFLIDIHPALQQAINQTAPDPVELNGLAMELIKFASGEKMDIYQPSGSPAFQFVMGGCLEEFMADAAHHKQDNLPYVPSVAYAHSIRDSKEVMVDGVVQKTSFFKHVCWIVL